MQMQMFPVEILNKILSITQMRSLCCKTRRYVFRDYIKRYLLYPVNDKEIEAYILNNGKYGIIKCSYIYYFSKWSDLGMDEDINASSSSYKFTGDEDSKFIFMYASRDLWSLKLLLTASNGPSEKSIKFNKYHEKYSQRSPDEPDAYKEVNIKCLDFLSTYNIINGRTQSLTARVENEQIFKQELSHYIISLVNKLINTNIDMDGELDQIEVPLSIVQIYGSLYITLRNMDHDIECKSIESTYDENIKDELSKTQYQEDILKLLGSEIESMADTIINYFGY